jgi:hypothetical protein
MWHHIPAGANLGTHQHEYVKLINKELLSLASLPMDYSTV